MFATWVGGTRGTEGWGYMGTMRVSLANSSQRLCKELPRGQETTVTSHQIKISVWSEMTEGLWDERVPQQNAANLFKIATTGAFLSGNVTIILIQLKVQMPQSYLIQGKSQLMKRIKRKTCNQIDQIMKSKGVLLMIFFYRT